MAKSKVIVTLAASLLVLSLVFAASASAQTTRTVPGDCINPGAEFDVTIGDAPGVGLIIEELCAGWTYKDSSLADYQVNVAGNVVTFTLVGDTSFTYTIEAPGAEDESCTIELRHLVPRTRAAPSKGSTETWIRMITRSMMMLYIHVLERHQRWQELFQVTASIQAPSLLSR